MAEGAGEASSGATFSIERAEFDRLQVWAMPQHSQEYLDRASPLLQRIHSCTFQFYDLSRLVSGWVFDTVCVVCDVGLRTLLRATRLLAIEVV